MRKSNPKDHKKRTETVKGSSAHVHPLFIYTPSSIHLPPACCLFRRAPRAKRLVAKKKTSVALFFSRSASLFFHSFHCDALDSATKISGPEILSQEEAARGSYPILGKVAADIDCPTPQPVINISRHFTFAAVRPGETCERLRNY